MKNAFIIIDWTSRVMFNGKEFDTFDDAEEFLCIELDDNYETDRGEFYIVPKTRTRQSRYLEPNHPANNAQFVTLKNDRKGLK